MQIASPLPRRNTVWATSADGVSIAYEVIGTGRPLMLLHGFTESRASWLEADYVERFAARGRQLVLVDCRGHGESGKPHQPPAYSARKCAADVAAVLDDAGIGWTDVMGYSMGGAIALAAALHIPERIGALVVNGAHPFAQDLSELRVAIETSFDPWLEWIQRMAPGSLSLETRRRILANDISALQACVACDRPDRSSALARLRAPHSQSRAHSIRAAPLSADLWTWSGGNSCRSKTETILRRSSASKTSCPRGSIPCAPLMRDRIGVESACY